MRAPSTLLLSTLALLQTALAIPPACLLGALNNDQQNLADIDTICSRAARDVQDNISNICGDMTEEALSYFADTCRQVANVNVASASSSASRTATRTATRTSGDASASETTGSATEGGSGSTTTTSGTDDDSNVPTPAATSPDASGTSQSTAAAATHVAGPFAAVALAAAGAIVAF